MSDDQTSIQNRNGLLFFVTINQSFNGLISVLNTFPKEKVIVNREISSNAYKLNSYFLSKFFVELPINILPPLVFSLILYRGVIFPLKNGFTKNDLNTINAINAGVVGTMLDIVKVPGFLLGSILYIFIKRHD